jgi:hypothetical protein
MFDPKSRYANAMPYAVVDRRGRIVTVVPPAEPRPGVLAGYHLRKQGQRLDHLAAHYLDDACAFWRLCDRNDAMIPDALAAVAELAIPTKED